ncbi:hypothetical protein NMY22_g11299 [Coprinellus aureogranulatus]|nr:hypothetical protein NMY22_g11299 [Coprinellus aureogranulatus]
MHPNMELLDPDLGQGEHRRSDRVHLVIHTRANPGVPKVRTGHLFTSTSPFPFLGDGGREHLHMISFRWSVSSNDLFEKLEMTS